MYRVVSMHGAVASRVLGANRVDRGAVLARER
jgi:hypothetical protein